MTKWGVLLTCIDLLLIVMFFSLMKLLGNWWNDALLINIVVSQGLSPCSCALNLCGDGPTMLGFLVTLPAKNSLRAAGAATTTNKKIPMENSFKEVLSIYSSMQESKNLCPLIRVFHQSITAGHLRFRLSVQIWEQLSQCERERPTSYLHWRGRILSPEVYPDCKLSKSLEHID